MIPPYSAPYLRLQQLLVEARHKRGLKQSEVAERLQASQSFVSKYERGERRLDVIELLQICGILSLDARDTLQQIGLKPNSSEPTDILDRWDLSVNDLTTLVETNPSGSTFLY